MNRVTIQQINGGYIVETSIYHPTVTDTTTGAITPAYRDNEVTFYATFADISTALTGVLTP